MHTLEAVRARAEEERRQTIAWVSLKLVFIVLYNSLLLFLVSYIREGETLRLNPLRKVVGDNVKGHLDAASLVLNRTAQITELFTENPLEDLILKDLEPIRKLVDGFRNRTVEFEKSVRVSGGQRDFIPVELFEDLVQNYKDVEMKLDEFYILAGEVLKKKRLEAVRLVRDILHVMEIQWLSWDVDTNDHKLLIWPGGYLIFLRTSDQTRKTLTFHNFHGVLKEARFAMKDSPSPMRSNAKDYGEIFEARNKTEDKVADLDLTTVKHVKSFRQAKIVVGRFNEGNLIMNQIVLENLLQIFPPVGKKTYSYVENMLNNYHYIKQQGFLKLHRKLSREIKSLQNRMESINYYVR